MRSAAEANTRMPLQIPKAQPTKQQYYCITVCRSLARATSAHPLCAARNLSTAQISQAWPPSMAGTSQACGCGLAQPRAAPAAPGASDTTMRSAPALQPQLPGQYALLLHIATGTRACQGQQLAHDTHRVSKQQAKEHDGENKKKK